MEIVAADIAANHARIRRTIERAAVVSGRSGDDIRLLAATKYLDAVHLPLLVESGIRDVAENRLDALQAKQDAVSLDLTWHFIGRLQSRKVPELVTRAAMLHTLCTDSAATRLGACHADGTVLPKLLVQVNTADDPSKDGLSPDAVPGFLDSLPDGVVVQGFMTMPAFSQDAEKSRPSFAALRRLLESCAPRFAGRHELCALSMGTSQDFAVAVEEGATHVRLGRILYA